MFRDYWLNESVRKMLYHHLDVLRENIKLKKELEKKQKLIKYYRKEKKKLVKQLDLYRSGTYTINNINPDTWCITYHYTPRDKAKNNFIS